MSAETRAARERLSAELRDEPPSSFDQLTPDRLTVLADALERQRASRAAGLTEAAEEALKLVPALARGPVRRILFR
ncbi:hypothetical protein DMA15_08930 [Streptomyces sp. WAC 01529]|uniref:hypothetical protein n=1 Tax=Streptomyces sp. WAC 01529 TaxID=2203205 RepID=UPI000F6DC7D1|nr:hypothetical protein [Streptomyces sp. WAC 01529]AZM52706.1 hypothetical protein DMA15_08930 [Streptomyces sp. WAC 01529]